MVEPVSGDAIQGIGTFEEVETDPLIEEQTLETDSLESLSNTDLLKNFLISGGSKDSFQKLLTTFYGETLTMRAFPSDWKDDLSRDHCLEILDRIGHAITLDDLEEFYSELKSGTIKNQILNHANIPYLRMWWATSVRDLPHYWINHLLTLFWFLTS